MPRRVRTPGGSKYYNLPVGAIITRDVLLAARLRNHGKQPPKGASMAVSSAVSTRGNDRPGSLGGGPDGWLKSAGHAPSVTTEAQQLDPKKPVFSEVPSIDGPMRFRVGGKEFGAPKGSTLMVSKDHPDIAYVNTPDGETHVFTPKGEVSKMGSVTSAKIKSDLAENASKYDLNKWSSKDTEGAKGGSLGGGSDGWLKSADGGDMREDPEVPKPQSPPDPRSLRNRMKDFLTGVKSGKHQVGPDENTNAEDHAAAKSAVAKAATPEHKQAWALTKADPKHADTPADLGDYMLHEQKSPEARPKRQDYETPLSRQISKFLDGVEAGKIQLPPEPEDFNEADTPMSSVQDRQAWTVAVFDAKHDGNPATLTQFLRWKESQRRAGGKPDEQSRPSGGVPAGPQDGPQTEQGPGTKSSKTVTLKDGSKVTMRLEITGDKAFIDAGEEDQNGLVPGQFEATKKDGKWAVDFIDVQKEHRRQGLATEMFDFANGSLDAPLVHADNNKMSPVGREFANTIDGGHRKTDSAGAVDVDGHELGGSDVKREEGGKAERPRSEGGDASRGGSGEPGAGSSGAADRGGASGVPAGSDAAEGDQGPAGRDSGAVDGRQDQNGDGPRLLIDGREVATKKQIVSNSNAGTHEAAGISTPPIYELDSGKEAQTFHDAIAASAAASPYGKSVYVYTPDEYKGMRLFLTDDGKGGFALKGDDIVSVFNAPDSKYKRAARPLIATAVDEGGTHLDAFDTVLPDIYAQEGFRPVARVKWDDQYAPPGWDYKQFGQFNGGRPDVVFMAFDRSSRNRAYVPGEGPYVDSYDEGAALAKNANDGMGIPSSTPETEMQSMRRFSLNWGDAERAPLGAVEPNASQENIDRAQKLQDAWAATATPEQRQMFEQWWPPEEAGQPGNPSLGDYMQWRDEKNALRDGRQVRDPLSLGETAEQPSPKDVNNLRDAKNSYAAQYVDENGHWTPERQALHRAIVARFLDGLQPVDHPTQLMNGGGPASGKGSMSKFVKFPATREVDPMTGDFLPDPKGGVKAAKIDPDEIKLQIPEAHAAHARLMAMKATGQDVTEDNPDRGWAGMAHEESSVIAAMLHQAALDRGYDVIYDGTGNSSPTSVATKVQRAHAAGYRVEANYLYTEPQTGLVRAKGRGDQTGRYVPESAITGVYTKLPGIFDQIKDAGIFDHVRLFDNNRERDPRLVGEGDGKNFDIKDPWAYHRFMSSRARSYKMTDPARHQHEVVAPDPDNADPDTFEVQVSHAADAAMDRAAQMEPDITARMTDIAKAQGVELVNMDSRLKKKSQTMKKIRGDATKQRLSPEAAAERVGDNLRYTFATNTDNIAQVANEVLNQFTANGYDAKVKNFWTRPGANYRGINAQLQDRKTGALFEVQFNTPESLAVKDTTNHPLYKQWGALPDGPEKERLNAQMIENLKVVPKPPGIETIAEQDTLKFTNNDPLVAKDAPPSPNAPKVNTDYTAEQGVAGPHLEGVDHSQESRFAPVPVHNDPAIQAQLKADREAGVTQPSGAPTSGLLPVHNDPAVVAQLQADREAGVTQQFGARNDNGAAPAGAPPTPGPGAESADYRNDPRFAPVPVQNDPAVAAALRNAPEPQPINTAPTPMTVPVQQDSAAAAAIRARAAAREAANAPAAPAAPATPSLAAAPAPGRVLLGKDLRSMLIGTGFTAAPYDKANPNTAFVHYRKTGADEATADNGTKVGLAALYGDSRAMLGEPGTSEGIEPGVVNATNGGVELATNPNFWSADEPKYDNAAFQRRQVDAAQRLAASPESDANLPGAWAFAMSEANGEPMPYQEAVDDAVSRATELQKSWPGAFPITISTGTSGKVGWNFNGKPEDDDILGVNVNSPEEIPAAMKTLAYRRAVARMTSAWNGMTNGGPALLLNDAAASALGRGKGAMSLDAIGMQGFWANKSAHKYGSDALDSPAAQALAEQWAHQTYDDTQKYLADHGIKYVDVWRGFRSGDKVYARGDQPVELRPLSSTSLDPEVAARFADVGSQWREKSYLVKMRVPAKDIFSVAGHGPGVVGESEVTVLNNPDGQRGTMYRSSGDRYADVIDDKNFTVGTTTSKFDDETPTPPPAPAAPAQTPEQQAAGDALTGALTDRPEDPAVNESPQDFMTTLWSRWSVAVEMRDASWRGDASTMQVSNIDSRFTEDGFPRAMVDLARWADTNGYTLESSDEGSNGEDLAKQYGPFGWVSDGTGRLVRKPSAVAW